MRNKDKQNEDIKELTYDILGNAFIGNLLDMSGDLDNTSQNLIAYLESDEIKQISKNNKTNQI